MRRAFAAGLLAASACDGTDAPPPSSDARVAAADGPDMDGDAPGHVCSAEAPSLALGAGHPFEPAPPGVLPTYPILTGGQGAFHIEISLRVDGRIDPDHVDLRVEVLRGGWLVSESAGKDLLLSWLGGVCSYDKLRLVLLDEGGGALPQDRLPEIVGAPLHLGAEMCTGASCGRWEGEIALTPFEG